MRWLSAAALNSVGARLTQWAGRITHGRSLSTELRSHDRAAAEAVRLKCEFLANISHEIRTPMNGILGLTHLTLATDVSDEQREYLELVRSSGEALMRVLDDLLDYSRIEAGKVIAQRSVFSLRECVLKSARAQAHPASAKKLEIAVQVDQDLPDMVVGDPSLLRQVLATLVGNALKFTEYGSIGLRVDRRSVWDGGVVAGFSVTDSGIGIPLDKQPMIFESFQQADGSMTRTYGGTGLGLTLCLRLVELLGGDIWVDSAVGRGSSFSFTIPLKFAPPSVAAPKLDLHDTAAAAAKPLSILVAEDNPVNQRVLVRMLQKRGHQATVAPNGREAVRLYEEQPFDLIVMDINMPEMDGLTAVGVIRQYERTSRHTHIPILALTAYALPGDRERCLEAGMDAYLTKPVNSSELWQRIAELVG